jgi:hypothetical protein
MGGGLARFLAKCTCANRSEAYSDAFSLREPVLTPDQVRGRLSLEIAMPWIRQRPQRGGRYPSTGS